jgi:hypothetical protein
MLLNKELAENNNNFQELIPAVRCIFLFLKKKQKGCRFHQG